MSKQQTTLPTSKRYISDAAKVVHRHLSDPNHVISEEEIASVRVGFTPSDEFVQEIADDARSHTADE